MKANSKRVKMRTKEKKDITVVTPFFFSLWDTFDHKPEYDIEDILKTRPMTDI